MTKKFAVGTTTKVPSASAEFVVPATDTPSTAFVGLRSGRRYDFASVVYTGKEVCADEVLRESKFGDADRAKTRTVVESFLAALARKKVGVTIGVRVSIDGAVELSEVQLPSTGENRRPVP